MPVTSQASQKADPATLGRPGSHALAWRLNNSENLDWVHFLHIPAVAWHRQVMDGGIPPLSRVKVGENRSTRSKTTKGWVP